MNMNIRYKVASKVKTPSEDGALCLTLISTLKQTLLNHQEFDVQISLHQLPIVGLAW